MTSYLSIAREYQDEDLVDLAAVLVTDAWRGRVTAYAGIDEFSMAPAKLRTFAAKLDGECRIELGEPTSVGLISLHFRTEALARRLRVLVELTTKARETPRERPTNHLRVDFSVEAAALDRFLAEFESIVSGRSDAATLVLNP